MKLILPFPPSVNTYWRHPNKGAFAGKSLISAAGRKFQSAACAAIVEQLRRLPKPTSAPASVEIVLFPPDISALVICIIVCLSWAVNHYRDNAIAYKEQRDKKVSELKQATATITDMQQRQRSADALDAKYTKELADAKAENDALRRKLDNGGRVFVKGKCPVPSSAETSSASGMGNDATVELSPVAGRNVLGIRDGIIRDQTALRTLQEYIRTQCLR